MVFSPWDVGSCLGWPWVPRGGQMDGRGHWVGLKIDSKGGVLGARWRACKRVRVWFFNSSKRWLWRGGRVVSRRPPGALPEPSRSPLGALPKASRRPPGGLPEAPGGSRRLPGGLPEASRRPPGGLPEASRRLSGGFPERCWGSRGAREGSEADLEANLGAFGVPPRANFGFFWGYDFRCHFRCASGAGLRPI